MPVATNVVEIIVQGTYPSTGSGAKNIFNVFHYRLLSGAVATATVVGNYFSVNLWSLIAANLSIDYTGVACTCRYLDDPTNVAVNCTTPASGGIALPRMPGEIAAVTPFRCVQRGRNFRGSKHFGPLATASVLKDELTAAAVTAWATAVSNMGLFIAVTSGQQYQPVVLSRNLSQLKVLPVSIVVSDIQTCLLNKTVGTMRKRKEKTQR